MSLVKIIVIYDYYSNKRVTPIFFREEELVYLSFDEFKARLFNEVPYLNKIATSLRLAIIDENLEVDLSPNYFNFQIKGVLEKEKTITVRAIVFDSPGLPTQELLKKKSTIQSRAKRSLNLLEEQTDDQVVFSDNDNNSDTDDLPANQRVLLPLERYAKKQKDAANDIERRLQAKRQELAK